MNKIKFNRILFIIILLSVSIFLFSSIFIGKIFASDLKYYGFYGEPGYKTFYTSATNNIATLGYSGQNLADYISLLESNGNRVIISMASYFRANINASESEWRIVLGSLKTKLVNSGTLNKVWGIYVFDEPGNREGETAEKINLAVNLVKEYFPDIYTYVIFFIKESEMKAVLNNSNLDIIGIDPYFLSNKYESSVSNAYICNTANKDRFNAVVKKKIYWIKSGGKSIENVCDYPYDCSAVDQVINQNTNKKIMLTGQSFKCNGNNDTGSWQIQNLPSICEQKWYYEYAKNDPDIIGLNWFKYSSSAEVANYNNAVVSCLGVSEEETPDMVDAHESWGLEVLCTNQETRPFCAENGVSYKNADQAKCVGKKVIKAGGAGVNRCDSNCGADSACHGVVPGTGACNSSCKKITITLTASPTTIYSGNSSTLTWSATNATSCTSSGAWSGSRAVSGTLNVSPTTTSTYTLSCSGAGGATATQLIMITVNNVPIVNSAPILSAIGNKTAIKGNNLNFIVSATDIDNDSLTYSIINIPSGATFINKSFNWTPSSNQIGIYNITFTVSDGKLTDAEIITITVVDTAVVEIPQNQPLDGEPLLIKINEDNRVYRIIDNKKFWIPTAEVFNQMNYNWNNIKITDKITLDTYSRVKLTRAIGDVKVYYLTESGLKKWIQTETIFNSYGNKWEDVIEVSGVELTAIPNGFLIKLQNAPRVYKLENNQKRWIQTAETFNRLKYDWSKIMPINQTEFDSYSTGTDIK